MWERVHSVGGYQYMDGSHKYTVSQSITKKKKSAVPWHARYFVEDKKYANKLQYDFVQTDTTHAWAGVDWNLTQFISNSLHGSRSKHEVSTGPGRRVLCSQWTSIDPLNEPDATLDSLVGATEAIILTVLGEWREGGGKVRERRRRIAVAELHVEEAPRDAQMKREDKV